MGLPAGASLGGVMLTSASAELIRGSTAPFAASNPTAGPIDRLEGSRLSSLAAAWAGRVLMPGVQMANRLNYWWGQSGRSSRAAICAACSPTPIGLRPRLPGITPCSRRGLRRSRHLFPGNSAREIFKQVLRYSQQQEIFPPLVHHQAAPPRSISVELPGGWFFPGIELPAHLPDSPDLEASASGHDRDRDRGRREILSRQGSLSDPGPISPECRERSR